MCLSWLQIHHESMLLGMRLLHLLLLLSFSVSYQYKYYITGNTPIRQSIVFGGSNSPLVDSKESILKVSITREPHIINLTWLVSTKTQLPRVPLRGFKSTTKQLFFACVSYIQSCCLRCLFQSHTNLSFIVLVQSQPAKLLVLEPTTVPLVISTKQSQRYPSGGNHAS